MGENKEDVKGRALGIWKGKGVGVRKGSRGINMGRGLCVVGWKYTAFKNSLVSVPT